MLQRIPVLAAIVLGAAVAGLPAAGAQTATGADADVLQAVARGLDYLERTQAPEGCWRADVGYKMMQRYMVTDGADRQKRRGGGHAGVSSLALIAYLAGGHVPGRGPYGAVMRRGIRYLLGRVNAEDGYISDHGTRMYSHAFATLCLAEIYGMTHQADLREKLQAAVNLIVKSQNRTGSWRYVPFSTKSDMSITVCQVQALRAARNVGLRVPASTIDRAIEYVMRSTVRYGRHRGAFQYQLGRRTRASFPLTAAGVTALYGAGVYDDDVIRRGLSYLRRTHGILRNHYRTHYFYYYGHYYAVQAMFIAGEPYWSEYYRKIRRELLETQQPDGSWPNDVGPGPVFGTAVACIVLQIPLRYLPIFQR